MYFLCVILIDYVFKTSKIYYPQFCLEECKYVAEEKKMPKYITDGIEISNNFEREDSDYSDEENCNEESYFE